MIYGAQQTIKLIRLCVFPEEGPAGGCSGPSPAPSLFEPPLPSVSLPPESLERFFSECFCLTVHTSSLLQLTRPERRSVASYTGLITTRVPKSAVAHHTMVLCQRDFGFQPLFSLPPYSSSSKPPTSRARAAVARSLAVVPIASPAVQSDILHSLCTRQVLSGESGASKRSCDCVRLGEPRWRAELFLENFE